MNTKRIFSSNTLIILAILQCASTAFTDDLPTHWQQGLAEGVNHGIAAGYPNDIGIKTHPNVLDSEDFETGAVVIPTEEDRYANNTTVVNTHSFTGEYSGQHQWGEGYNGPTTRYQIPSSAHQGVRPTYFMRMYFNFDNSFHPGDNFEGVGIKGFGITSDPTGIASTNTPCDGTNWYNAQAQFVGWGPSVKPQANDRYLWVGHLYSYNAYPIEAIATMGEIKISSPAVGEASYRFSSYATPFTYLDFGGWHCYEVGLYLNTPGQFNGEARFWIDGILQSRVTGMRYRDIENLFPTNMQLNLHRTTDNFPQIMTRWTDNIVLATSYIGPVNLTDPKTIDMRNVIGTLQTLAGFEATALLAAKDVNDDNQIGIAEVISWLQKMSTFN